MKNVIIILILFLVYSCNGIGQIWNPIYKKTTYQDSTRFIKDASFNGPLRVNSTFKLGGITITSNGTELNILDGVLANANEINKLVGIGNDTLATRAYARTRGGSGGSMTYPSTGIALSNGTSWSTSIANNSNNWNTAYSWGNHATAGYVPNTRTVNGKVLSSNITITATDLGLGNVTNESKYNMFTNPTFTGTVTLPTTWYIGTGIVNATAAELNKLSGVIVTASNINQLVGITDNIQQQLNSKTSTVNTHFTGITVVDRLQIGASDSALIIGAMSNAGAGLTVYDSDGNQVPYNNPVGNTINVTDIPTVPKINTADGDTSNYPIPDKIGDIFIDTNNNYVYISKSSNRGGWLRLN